MTEDTARRSIDWLHDNGCRVLALMGGEPLLRPQFVHKVVYYAAKKGFWIYVPTNGRLLRPDVIDRLGDAGVATFNLAVDAVDEKPGLPKALSPIRKYFDHLVRRQYRYGYTVFFNMNICRNNMDDIRAVDRNRARAPHRHRLPHQRNAHDRARPFRAPGRQRHLHPAGGLAAGGRTGGLADREEQVRIQDGELGAAAQRNARVHAREAAGMELPGGP